MSCSKPDIADRLLLYLESKVHGKLCSRCGTEIKEGTALCGSCGNPVSTASLSDSEMKMFEDHIKQCPDCSSELTKLKGAHMLLWENSKEVFPKILDCPSSDQLVDFASGEISDRKIRKTIKDHLSRCSKCQKEYGLLKALDKDLAADEETAYEREEAKGGVGFDKVISYLAELLWGRKFSRYATVAATLAILCSLSWLLLNLYFLRELGKQTIVFVIDNRVMAFRSEQSGDTTSIDDEDMKSISSSILNTIKQSDELKLGDSPDAGNLFDPLDLFNISDTEMAQTASSKMDSDILMRVVIDTSESIYVITCTLIDAKNRKIIAFESEQCKDKNAINSTISVLMQQLFP